MTPRRNPTTLEKQPDTASLSTAPPISADAAPARPGPVIALLVASAFVVILNETIMSVALPRLMADLDITASTAQWLTTGFLLTMAVVIPLTGYLLERFPLRRIFFAAMTLFAIGTLIGALAPGFEVLLLGRIVQASGTAIMMPLLFTTVLNVVPASHRGRMMGVISIVIAVAPAVGRVDARPPQLSRGERPAAGSSTDQGPRARSRTAHTDRARRRSSARSG